MADHEYRDLPTEIRKGIVDELQAITSCQEHAAQTLNNEAQELFRQIADDERHHAMELLKLLIKVDPRQCRAFLREFGRSESGGESCRNDHP